MDGPVSNRDRRVFWAIARQIRESARRATLSAPLHWEEGLTLRITRAPRSFTSKTRAMDESSLFEAKRKGEEEAHSNSVVPIDTLKWTTFRSFKSAVADGLSVVTIGNSFIS